MDIDPGFLPYLNQAVAGRTEPLDRVNVPERRAKMAAVRAASATPPPEGVHVAWHTVDNSGRPLRALVFRPTTAGPFPAIVYCHGGGWMYGSPEQSAELAYLYVQKVGAVVVSPEYHLSPEHPYPAGFDGCYAALCWTAKEAARIGVDPHRIAVAGESSGGNLAAACALAARDRNGPKIALQLLNYPALGTNFDTASYRDNADAPILSRDEMIYFWRAYLKGETARPPAYAAPLAAESLAGLPPAHIVVAEYDPLRDDGIAFAERLRAAGTPVALRRAARLTHGFFRGLSACDSADVKNMASAVCDALRAALCETR